MMLKIGSLVFNITLTAQSVFNLNTGKMRMFFPKMALRNFFKGKPNFRYEPDTERETQEFELHNRLWRCVPETKILYWTRWPIETHTKGWRVFAERVDNTEYEVLYWSNGLTPMDAVLHTENVGKGLDKLLAFNAKLANNYADKLSPEVIADIKRLQEDPIITDQVSFSVKQQREQNK